MIKADPWGFLYAVPYDFTIIIGKKKYPIHKAMAFRYSATLVEKQKENRSLVSYELSEIVDPEGYFKIVIDFLYDKFDESTINSENAPFINYVSQQLGINDLANISSKYIQQKPTMENALTVFSSFAKCKIPNPEFSDFIADNWDTFKNNTSIADVPIYGLEDILTNENLKAEESDVFNFIKKLCNTSHKYDELLGSVCVEYLDTEERHEYINLISYDSISPKVISALREIIISGDSQPYEDDYHSPQTSAPPSNPHPQFSNPVEPQYTFNQYTMEGFGQPQQQQPQQPQFSYPNQPPQQPQFTFTPQPAAPVSQPEFKPAPAFNTYYGQPQQVPQGNDDYEEEYEEEYDDSQRIVLQPKGDGDLDGVADFVKLAGMQLRGGGNKLNRLPCIFSKNDEKFWDNYDGKRCTKQNAWVSIELKQYRLRLSAYTLASEKKFIRSWQILGSNDGQEWTEIQTVKSAEIMRDGKAHTYNIEQEDKFYRFFKVSMLENWMMPSSYEFNLSHLELFGTLEPTS